MQSGTFESRLRRGKGSPCSASTPTRYVRGSAVGNKRATDGTGSSRTQTNSSPGIEPNPEPRRAPPNSRRGLRNRRSQVRNLSDALSRTSGGILSGMFVFLLSMLGSAVFVGLALCVRRFDSKGGTDAHGSDGGGGGGGRGPCPDPPVEPLAVIDPPLGEIRANGPRERVTS